MDIHQNLINWAPVLLKILELKYDLTYSTWRPNHLSFELRHHISHNFVKICVNINSIAVHGYGLNAHFYFDGLEDPTIYDKVIDAITTIAPTNKVRKTHQRSCRRCGWAVKMKCEICHTEIEIP